jgi:extradiol dioxygenase family protein
MYVQWGYNRDRYSKSTIHFWDDGQYDFTLHDVVAHDRPDFTAFRTNPIDITIPQNSIRIGVYLNAKHTHAIELNFDHAKYVVNANQRVRMEGEFFGSQVDKDTTLVPWFIDFEHSNGANFLLLNYVGQHELLRNKKRVLASCVWKAGAGIVIPRSDVRIMAYREDNVYHVAGYILGAEAGLRFYPLRNLFLEATLKGGYANYCNVLTVQSGRASHRFFYGEVVGLLGYDMDLKKWFGKKTKTGS